VSRILIFGGTRFAGKLVATDLATRHDVLCVSRNEIEIPGVRRLVAQREEGFACLAGEKFDLVLDFIAFSGADLAQCRALGARYIAISTSWLPRLAGFTSATAPVPPDASRAPATMMDITKNYLVAKATLEHRINELRAGGYPATAVRLPIIMGVGDHSGRSLFYSARIADGGPILMVDGGVNLAQVLWSEDAARIVVALVDSDDAARFPVWEGLPDDGIRVRDFVGTIAKSMKLTADLHDAPLATLQAELPDYLDVEPLWRERPLERSEANLFRVFGLSPHPVEHWMAGLSSVPAPAAPTRGAEIALAGRRA
jgi:nucleoside-diphosphate-sugar epimerase